MFHKIKLVLEMIRFSHTIFALPFAMLAAVLAWKTLGADGQAVAFRVQDLAGILICMVAARSAAMAFNRLVDHKIDAENPRTRQRHLPAGLLTGRSVVLFTVVSSMVFVAATLLFLPNRLPLYLAVPVLVILLFYSFTKRLTSLAHYWLGFSLMLAPVAAWIAIRGQLILESSLDLTPALTLGVAVLFWVAGFDIIYSCQDHEFDRNAKLRSIPTRFGIAGALKIAAISHFAMVVVLLALPGLSMVAGVPTSLGWIWYLAVGAVAALLVYEHSLVRPDDLTRVNVAFFNVNSVVSFGLFVAGLVDTVV